VHESDEARGDVAGNNSAGIETPERRVKLRTLAPEYNENQHGIYVRHLEDAIQDKKNRNIALTGRYGTGKSSVLDAFEESHEQSTIRVAINTLGPDENDKDLTNRIQKELVKQLVYRLKPGQIRRSRFARPKPLTKRRALFQATGVSVIGLSLMWLLGVHPAAGSPAAERSWPTQASLGLVFFALVVLAVWTVRWLIGDRIVSEVTTAGTRIALDEGPTTYFDSFLDEIVAFFDAVDRQYVIFEDLDRFDDPQIFDSLRELNTLINSSAHWKEKEEPLRFIYAIKDSLFEKLGAEAKSDDDDTENRPASDAKPRLDVAAAAVQRANRTKFFELVIPIVPFISHRNARDHLVDALKSLGFAEDYVSRPLLDLIARHTTDMRLMINICNEFAVFAEHLLWTKNPAPGMKPDHLFALVAYKNFHLADFEAISQRESTLDQLVRHHRDDVRVLIGHLQELRRKHLVTEDHRRRKEQTATDLGVRLREITTLFPGSPGRPYVSVAVDGQTYAFGAVDDVGFWEHVAKTQAFSLTQQYNGTTVTATTENINRIFPEVLSSADWLDPDPAELGRLLQQRDEDIATLRGADFAELARYERVPEGQIKFDQRITDDLKSELARDLVRRGFITRNFAEYSAVFYGSFVGVDVAFFYNHSVQPYEMYLDYEFSSENAVSNLLEQVPADFTSSVSALNLQVASYLLSERSPGAKELVAFIVTHDNDDVRAFLDAFLNSPAAPRELLVEYLTEHPWRDVFEYLSGHPSIPDQETRLRLFDVALLCSLQADSYEIGETSRNLLESSYLRLTAVSEPQTSPQTKRIFEILQAAKLVVADLAKLSESLRDLVVTAHMYEISVPNLRLALGIDGAPTLDEVCKSPSVWGFCESRISDYVRAIEGDESTPHIVLTESVLVDVLHAEEQSWTEDQLREIIYLGAPSATIRNLEDVPQTLWPTIVDARLMAPTASNLSSYARVQGVDGHLAAFLTADEDEPVEIQDVVEVNAEARMTLAVTFLNAATHLTAQVRVQLADQLSLETALDLSELTILPDQLLARALEAELLPDSLETFAYFAVGGWEAVSEAFAVSRNIANFMTPALVKGFVPEFLESDEVPTVLRQIVVENIGEYIPEDDAKALSAAGRYACHRRIWLPLDDVRRIAQVAKTADAVLAQLAHAKDTSLTDLVTILASLGEPYENLEQGPGTEFDLPTGSSSATLFKRLEAAGRVKIVQKVIRRGRKVHNLV
jgi:hypothetical protein